jgi:hypothetical protein
MIRQLQQTFCKLRICSRVVYYIFDSRHPPQENNFPVKSPTPDTSVLAGCFSTASPGSAWTIHRYRIRVDHGQLDPDAYLVKKQYDLVEIANTQTGV